MPQAPKRKRLEKTVEGDPIFATRFYCSRCGTSYSRQKGFFPVSHSPMYRGSGYFSICSACVDEMYEDYRRKLGSDRAAMKRMCMKLDLYWNEKIYEMAERAAGVNSRVRSYISKTNIIRYIDKTYDDTIAEEDQAARDGQPIDIPLSPPAAKEARYEAIEVPQEIKDFWGPGYSPEMYLELDERYKYWMSKYQGGKPDIGEEAIIRQICNLEIDINHARATGQPIDRSVNALNTLLGSANLKPTQKKDNSDGDLENTPFGMLIRKWEDTRPIPEPDPELQDVDGLRKYITIWFLGHLCKMLNIKNSYCKMYEDEMERLRVSAPKFDDEEDDEEGQYSNIFARGDEDEDA